MPGDRRIDACIDHFGLMGYDAGDVCVVVADLLKVYDNGPVAWRFLEEGRYKVVQDRLLEIEDQELKLKKDQQLLLERYQQRNDQQVEDEREPPQVPDRVLQKREVQVSTHVSRAPALTGWGGDASSSATQPPSSDNIKHDIVQATTPSDVAQGTGTEHGPRRGTRVRRPSHWVKGSEWV